MNRIRHAAFVAFAVLYIIICPLTVLYALGYLYQPGAAYGIVKTGLIALSTTPPGATIYLEGKRYVRKTPTVLQGLIPGTYRVTVILKRHQPWMKTVRIEAEKAAVYEHVLLLPDPLRIEPLTTAPWDEVIPLIGTHYVLLRQGGLLGKMAVYDWDEQSRWDIVDASSPWASAKVVSLLRMSGSLAWLMQVEARDGLHDLWMDIKNQTVRIEDVTNLLPHAPQWILWDPTDRRHLFVGDDEQAVSRIDLTSRSIQPQWLDHVRGMGVFERSLYVLNEAAQLQRLDEDGKPDETLLDNPVFGRALFGEQQRYRLHVLSKDTVLFLGEHGALLTNRPPYRLIDKGVIDLEWDPHTDQVLVWQRNALGFLRVARKPLLTDSPDPGMVLHWLPVKGKNLQQVFFVHEGAYVVYRDEDDVFLIEADRAATPPTTPLVSVKHNTSIAYTEESGKLYYLDRATGLLMSLEVLPKHELLPLALSQRWEHR